MFLFQLLALMGEWDKADMQLRTLASLSPGARMLADAYGAAIAAERLRASAFAGQQDFPVLLRGGDWIDPLAHSLRLRAVGEIAAADAARIAAFDAVPDMPGTADDVRFEWIADADSRFGPALEAIIQGQWGLIGLDAVEAIESAGARDLRDLVWYPVKIRPRSGGTIAAMLPVRYPGSEISPDRSETLARVTNWRDQGSGACGSGQRLLALSSGEALPLLSLRALAFD